MQINPKDLMAISGKLLSYPQICNGLGVPVKSGDSRAAFFDRLKLCCDVERKGRKYIISNVAEESPFYDIHANNKFQVFVDQLILEALKKEDGEPLYLSKREILQELGLINQNYKFTRSYDNIKYLGSERQYLYDCIPRVTAFLFSWVKRRLESMNKRGIVLYTNGFGALRKMIVNGEEVIMRENFQYNSEKEKLALQVYKNARLAALPESMKDSLWIPPEYATAFKEELETGARQVFGPEYVSLFQTIIIRSNKAVVESSIKNCRKILNDESIRKISETKQLNQLTGHQRELLVKEVIALNPPIDYKTVIKQKEKLEWEGWKKRQNRNRKNKEGD